GDRQVTVGRRRRSNGDGAIGRRDVRRTAVGVGVHRDALDPNLAARTNDTDGDLAAIRHEEAFDHAASSCTEDTRSARTKDTRSARTKDTRSARTKDTEG